MKRFLAVFAVALVGLFQVPTTYGCEPFNRGDINHDLYVDLSDVVYFYQCYNGLANWPPNLNAADVNHDGVINLSDAIYLSAFLYQGGASSHLPLRFYRTSRHSGARSQSECPDPGAML